MMLRKLALSSAAFLVFAGVSLAQTSSLQGEVKGEDGKPLKDALIKIERKDIKGNYKVKTNKKGEFFHAGLPLGTYDVILEVNGKDVDRMNGVRTRLGDSQTVNFDMQATKNRQEALQKAAETGQLSQEQARQLSPEQKAALEKQAKERAAALAKNKALNDAFNTGMQALQAKQYDQAIEAFTKGSEMDPNQHVIWAHLADSYKEQAKTKTGPDQQTALNKALENYQKAISLAPNDAAYHNNYALALAQAKKPDEAQAELAKAAELDPPGAGRYYYNLGALLVNSGQNDAAGNAFKKAIELDPNYADAYFQYGVSLMGKATTTPDGKIIPPEGTKEAFEKYLQLKPDGPFAEGAKGMLATIGGKIETEYRNPNAPPPSQKKSTKKK